jgi:hypothetical protein
VALAFNQYYVAAAAKAQADKASAIVSSQIPPNTQNSTFYGCVQGAYPSSFGSGRVAAVFPSGYQMESGQQLLYGNCTLLDACAVGDLLYFQGYLRDGGIHLLKASKLQG